MAKHFTDLIAWQLADRLETFVAGLLARTSWKDPELVRQITNSSTRAPANIAEGFGRFSGGGFGYFLKIAIGSEFETRDHLIRAEKRRYIQASDRDEGVILAKRASTAAIRLRQYVLSTEGQENAKRIEQSARPRERKNREP